MRQLSHRARRTVRFLISITLVLGSMGLSAGVARSADLYVNPDGLCGGNVPCFTTISAALAAAGPGDIIHVAAGNYAGPGGINFGVTLLGPNAGTSPNGGARVPEAVIVSGSPSIRVSTTDPVVIQGFEFNGTGLAVDSYTTDATVTLRENIFRNITVQTFFFANSDLVVFDDNYLTSNADDEALFIAGDWNGTTGTIVSITDNVWENSLSTGMNLSSVSGDVSGNRFTNIQYYAILLANSSGPITITDNEFDGVVNPDPGVTTWGAGVRFYTPSYPGLVSITDNDFMSCYVGIGVRSGSNIAGLPISVTQNRFTGNTTGIRNDGTGTLAATCNWWGDALGPNVPPGNPSPGDDITGSALYSPWWTTASGPCNGYGADNIAALLDTCISTVHPCETADMLFTRSDPTSMRGYSVSFHLSPELMLCSTPTASITKGPYLTGPDGTMFQVVDNGGGSYTVDEAILGDPCVATGSGVLFRVRVKNAGGDGIGTITVDSVTVRDCFNDPLPGIPGVPGNIDIDDTPTAAIGDLAAIQLRTGNDTDGSTKIQITYTAPAGAAEVKVYRAGFGNYPEYDDPPGAGSVPATPSWPPPSPWAPTSVTASGQWDEVANRDFWYFVAFAVDSCGNVSPVSNKTAGTLNYHLGDVHDGVTDCQGNNLVNTSDISFLGAHYAITLGVSDPLGCLDVGPTTDNYIHGRPKTDNRVQFEDLMMFAINYSEVSKTQSALLPASTDELIVLVPADQEDGFLARVWVRGTGRVQGLSAQLAWNAAAVEPLEVLPGELLQRLGGVAFAGGSGLVDAALLGVRDQGLAGEGDLATVRFRVIGSGDPGISIASVEARDRDNQRVEMGTRSSNVDPTASLPRVTALLANVPNPFNPSTKLPFTIAGGGHVELAIFTVDGRRVRTLVNDVRQPGLYETTWNGTDESGSRVSSGAYYVRLVTRDGTQARPVVMLK